MRKLIIFFRNLSIQRKFLIFFLITILLPVLILGYSTNKISTDNIIQETYDRSSDNLLLINHSLDNLTKNIEYFVTNLSLMVNTDLQGLNLANDDAINELNIQNRLVETFNKFVVSFPNLSSGMFISVSGSIYGRDFKPNKLYPGIKGSDIIKDIQKSDGSMVWFDIQKRNYLNDENADRQKYLLTVGKKVYNLRDGSILGSLVLNVTEDKISSIYSDIKLGQTGRYLIINNIGTIISSQDKTELMTGIDENIFGVLETGEIGKGITDIDGVKHLVVFREYEKLDWKIIGLVPVNELMGESFRISIAILLATIMCFLLAFIVSIILSRIISKRIKEITHFTKNVAAGDLTLQYESNSKDEIGQLGDGLNHMILNTRHLIDDIYVQHKKEKDLELKVLQLQINPHFLYNTLDSLYWLLIVNKQKKSAEIVSSLSKLFRYSITGDNGLASIAEEMFQLDNYLSIQKLRFSDKIEYKKEIDNDILSYSIPKLTLQPIIENAINHGLKNKDNYGDIFIKGEQDNDHIIFTIEDNGAGMSEEEIEKLSNKQHIGSGTGLGINNVSERIQLLMGLDNAIEIRSEKGSGTIVQIRLPKIKWEKSDGQA